MAWFLEIVWNVVLAGAIVVAAIWLGTWVKRWVVSLAEKHEHIDATLFLFLGTLARYAILGLAAVFVLAQFGVQTTSLVALIGAAGLAIGLALQGTLSNIASGVMLIVLRPLSVGEYVSVKGGEGTVKAISLFHTELSTVDNLQVFVPNSQVFGGEIVNYSRNDTRRIDLVIGVAYDADLRKAEAAIRGVLEADTRIHESPAPFVKVVALGESSVDFGVRVWVDRGDFLEVKTDLLRGIKEALDAAGVEIPFPTRTIVQATA